MTLLTPILAITSSEWVASLHNNPLRHGIGKGREVERAIVVRELQRQLKAAGVPLVTETDETTTGPASFVAVDPDGNPILFDQHV